MDGRTISPDGALPFSDVAGLLSAAASAEKQQALVARIFVAQPSDPSPLSSVNQFAQLSSVAKQLQGFVHTHTQSTSYLGGQDYIWHREPPSISVVCPPSSSNAQSSASATHLPPHILFHLRTGGECMEDEWFATHLLLRASTHFAQQQLCITVEDKDGQFLLVEAAEHIPDWVTPEAVVNRVWIFQGHLHLIPPHHKSDNDGAISISDAVELVRDQAVLTRASDHVEAAAFARAFEFPSAAAPHHHRTLAYLPRKAAHVLATRPQLISSCVASIQSRDIVSSRSGSRLVHFPPPSSLARSNATPPASAFDSSSTESDDEIVLAPICMTRHLYVQLLYDRFFPPRQLGAQWQASVEKYRARIYRQPAASGSQAKVEDEDEVQAQLQHGRWYDLGAKIWCGLEMAYTDSLARRTRTKSRPMVASEQAISTQEKQKLISSLEKLGYFQGEIEGSAKWKLLEAEALSQYAKGTIASANTTDIGEGTLLCDEVDGLLQRSERSHSISVYSIDTPVPELKKYEDDDSWLQLDPSDIDSILQNKTSSDRSSSRPIDEQDTFQRLNIFNTKMEDFIKTKSNVDGALFEDELNADDMLLEEDDLLFEDVDDEEQEQQIRSQVEQRMQTEGETKKKELVDRLLPKMSQSEWTRKPAFSNGEDEKQASIEKGDKRGKHDFVASIDRIAAERDATQPRTHAGSGTVAMRNNNLSRAQEELVRRLDSQYMRETSTLLASQNHNRYDGASDSDDESIEEETSPEVRRRLAEEYELEPDPEPTLAGKEDPSKPAQAGTEMEIEMGMDEETEVDNLLEFARVSLGLTKEQYEAILEEREQKGRYVPASTRQKEQQKEAQAAEPKPKLDSFESVMDAMEDYLESNQPQPTVEDGKRVKPTKAEASATAEDKELLAHLLKSKADLPASLQTHLEQGQQTVQSQQLDGFLRSFQAQSSTTGVGAGSGPVEVLMRRFGLGSLPADQDPHTQQ